MENQDHLFHQIKAAADNAETPPFAAMDKVWNRVEEKLDTKRLKKETHLWKKIAVAASVLLLVTLGYQFFQNESPKTQTNETISQKDSILPITSEKEALVVTDSTKPVIRKNAAALLQKQIKTATQEQVALNETFNPKQNQITSESITASEAQYLLSPVASEAPTWKNDVKEAVKRKAESKDLEMFINKETIAKNARPDDPIIVVDNKVSSLQLINKMEASQIDSIVILKEPLYIINGVYYSEKEVFGPNPTSPYSPLNQQDIESIEVLQHEKAIEQYGEKGNKGVVIISTKNGKPAVKKSN
ncbi:hypothetical protein [Flavobacterium sp. XGLA_31]|uniref:hypothetical protein n=1 Tax=Flavobacterium sp. XGLA_31 TaxID=3447666 RepID=UPI003F3ADE8F